MTNQPLAETPPSTEVMTKVVCRYKDWDAAVPLQEFNVYGQFMQEGGEHEVIPDPRTDLSEAMRLLGWLYFEHEIDFQIDTIWKDNQHVTGWGVGDLEDQDYHIIPLTGLPFCTAVCNLAAKCLGLSEGGA